LKKSLPYSRKAIWQALVNFWMNRKKASESTLKTAALLSNSLVNHRKRARAILVPELVEAARRLGHSIDFFVTRPSGVA